MFLHEPGEEAESFSRMELSTANSRQNNQKSEYSYGHLPQPSRPPPREHHPPPSNAHLDGANQMARTTSLVGSTSGDNDGASALPLTANWAKNPPTPASRPASLVHSIVNSQPKVPTPGPKDIPPSPLAQKVQTVRNQENGKKAPDRTKPSLPSPTASAPSNSSDTNSKNVGVIGQPVPAAAKTSPVPPPAVAVAAPKPKPVQPSMPTNLTEQHARMQRMLKAFTDPRYCFVLDKEAFGGEFENLCNVPPMFDKHGGRRRRELQEKSKKQQQIGDSGNDGASESGQQAPIGTVNAPPMGGVPLRGLTPLQQQQQREMIKDVSGQQQQNIQGLATVLQQESLLQQQQSALRAQTPQGLHQQAAGQQGFGAFSSGQAPMTPAGGHQGGHARQSSRYTFANDNPLNASTTVNARSNAAHMAEQLRMMPPQQQQMPHQQLAQMYGGAPGLGGSLLGGVQQPPPGLKNAPTPPAPGLGGIPMGNMPGLGQFSGMGLGGHHNKNGDELLQLFSGNGASRGATSASLMRGGDGKRNIPLSAGGRFGHTDRRGVVDLGDPSILQARVAQPQHQLQHQQGIQAGGHGQQGGYNPMNYYASPQAAGRW
jgi:CCR4-NOT transcription complex subunit 4